MKLIWSEKNQAYLTVYLALTMTVLLSLYLALIEGTRSNAIRLEAECITDIGLNSVLAEYHRELYTQYNLFAIDTSYGTPQAGSINVEKHLREYLERNMSAEDIILSGYFYKDFLAMSVKKIELTKVSCLTDGGGAVFRKRAVEAIKDDVGISLMEEVASWTRTVTENQMDKRDIAAEKQEIDEKLQEYNGKAVQDSANQWKGAEISNPTDELEKTRNKGILRTVVESPQMLSEKSIFADELIQARMKKKEINQGNMVYESLSVAEQMTERFFFQEYLIKYMGRYGCEDEENALQYQLEYLVSGENSDVENLQETATALCAIREVANVIYLFSDEAKCAAAETLAVTLATLMLVPEISELLKMTLLFGWAYAESLYDVEMLLKGGRVPLLKDDSTWHYDLESALSLGNASEDSSVGLSYVDYLRILMSMSDLDTLTARAMDMVEADIRRTSGNAAFRLDACYDSIEASVGIGSAYGYEYELTRQKKY